MARIQYKENKKKQAFVDLERIYSSIPETSGCIENISKPFEEGGCNGLCCRIQNPQLLYCEFLRTLDIVLNDWPLESFCLLIKDALTNYLYGIPTKGCIFFDKNTNMCMCHKTRPLACYIYGIEADEDFIPRIERIKEEYKGNPLAVFMDQCRKCKTIDGSMITKDKHDILWDKLVKVEESIGIDKNKINDGPGGTYRTFHDHLLIFLLPDYMLENLTHVRKFGKPEEKTKIISVFMKLLSPAINAMRG